MSGVAVAFLAAVVVAAGWVAYAYAGYPLLIWTLARFRGARIRADDLMRLPTVALVVSAHNEEVVIAEKIHNALSLDYPRELLEVWISSDGSTDRTNEIAATAAASEQRLHVLAYEKNRGKTATLMDTLAQLPPAVEVVVFSDANGLYAPDALRWLVAPLGDPHVAAVTGRLVYAGRSVESYYRRYENWIKRNESAVRSCVVAEGSIFAARRHLIPELPSWQIEDLAIPVAISLAGYDVVFEPRAQSVEQFDLSAGEQFARRKRIVNRSVRTTLAYRAILNPFRTGLVALMFVSHRVLRWLAPTMMLTAVLAGVVCGLLTAPRATLLAAAAACVAAAAVGAVATQSARAAAAFRFPAMFLVANAAVLAGIVSVLRGRRIVTWTPSR